MANAKTSSILIWGGFIVLVIALLWGLASIGGKNSPSPSTPGQNGATLTAPAGADEQTRGPADARLTLVEYSDFQCPACAASAPLLKQLAADFPSDVRLVYRHFPLRQIHPNAQLAGQAAEAAGRQGKFWEFHDALFNTQTTWADQSDPEAFFVELARSLELNTEQFLADMKSDAIENKVNRDYASGNAARIPGTPTFFLNGKQIQNPSSYAALRALIEQELNA